MVIKMIAGMISAVALMSAPAHGQIVVNAQHAAVQPTVSRDDKGFKSCGVRAVVLFSGGKKDIVYDFSVNIYPDSLWGMIKAGSHNSNAGKLVALQPAPVDFWIVGAEDGVPLRPKKLIPAEAPGFVLGVTELIPALEAMSSMAYGKRMQFAVRYKHEALDRVVSFQASMEKDDLITFEACSKGMQSRLNAVIEAQGK